VVADHHQMELVLQPGARDAADLAAAKTDLFEVLRGRGWMTAKQLKELGFNDRLLRQIVEADEDAVFLSYPGSPGYRLFAEATLEEIEHTEALRSQGRAMLRRFVRYQRRRHRKAVQG
jgi:hypothetical protein